MIFAPLKLSYKLENVQLPVIGGTVQMFVAQGHQLITSQVLVSMCLLLVCAAWHISAGVEFGDPWPYILLGRTTVSYWK